MQLNRILLLKYIKLFKMFIIYAFFFFNNFYSPMMPIQYYIGSPRISKKSRSEKMCILDCTHRGIITHQDDSLVVHVWRVRVEYVVCSKTNRPWTVDETAGTAAAHYKKNPRVQSPCTVLYYNLFRSDANDMRKTRASTPSGTMGIILYTVVHYDAYTKLTVLRYYSRRVVIV